MAKRNTVWARNSNRRVRSKDKGSDESDEDYVISDEDEDESEAELKEYASSLEGEEVSFDGFDAVEVEDEEEVEEEEEDVMLRNVEWPKVKTGPRGNRKITGCKSRKVNRVVSDEEDVDLDDADDEEEVRDSRKVVGRSNVKAGSLGGEKHIGKRRRVFYEVEDEDPEEDGKEEDERGAENVDLNSLDDGGEDGEMALEEQDNVSHETEKEDDGDYEDEDGDEDFTADEDVSLDEEEEEEERVACNKRSLKVCKKTKRKRGSGGGRKRRKKGTVAKVRVTRGRRRRGKETKRGVDEDEDDDDDGDFVDDCIPVRKKAKTRSSRPRRRCTVASDSDIASSGESEYEYTISEEEKEQIREAASLLRSRVKHVSSVRQNTVHKDLPQPRKSPMKKGVELVNKDVVKNVCGICLSEEDMRKLKGTLDCCSHYFCFTCIMEWSKVESRCPICKQRFKTIRKLARSTLGVDLREVVIHVPERDQVYQPTEEELRSYLDPYANTICAECHQGDDDNLMLLCDTCDSSAHTYCVGLGMEVPEGHWYCEGCSTVALGSASSQTQTTSEQQRVNGLSSRPPPLVVSGQYQDASSLVSPRTEFLSGENLFSPRLPNVDGQSSSPSGIGATTLSRRRTLHRHIQNIINGDRLINMGSSRSGGTSFANSRDGFMPTQVGHFRETEPSQPAVTQETGISLYAMSEERLPSNHSLFSSNDPSHFGSQEAVRRLSSNTFLGDHRHIDLRLGHGLDQGVPLFGNQHHLPSYMPNTLSSMAGERLQQRVQAHLKNLSSQINLGQATFNEISTCSVHTILAACGLEHKSSEVHLVPPPLTCPHDHMTPGSSSSSSSTSNSLMKGCCYSCFDSFVEDVVKMILDTRQPHWLRLGLH